MRGIKALLMIPMAAVLLLAGACTNNSLDDGDGADVILQIVGVSSPAVTAVQSQDGTCSVTTTQFCTNSDDCPDFESCNVVFDCTLTVVDWTVMLSNIPKNTLAGSPANDIAMVDVTATYGLTPAVPPRTFGLGGTLIPTGGGGNVTFIPIALQDLVAGHASTTGSVSLLFRGHTLEGTTVTATVVADLSVEECL